MSVPTDPGAERKDARAPASAPGTSGEAHAAIQPAVAGAPAAKADGYLGVVFAGGESRRMGQDKALLPWPMASVASGDSTSLMERAARTLDGLCGWVEVARGPRGAASEAGRPVILDVVEGAGPLAGLLAALERAGGLGAKGVIALACDMPLVGKAELEPLLRQVEMRAPGEGGMGSPEIKASDAAMWMVDDREQPLCAVYRLSCLPAARAAFGAGKRRLVAIFDPAATGGHAPVLERLSPDEKTSARLVNLNTMSDYDRLRNEVLRGTR